MHTVGFFGIQNEFLCKTFSVVSKIRFTAAFLSFRKKILCYIFNVMDSERIKERTSDYEVEYIRDGKGRPKKEARYKGPDFYYVLPEEIRKKARILLGAFIFAEIVFTMIPLLIPDPLMHKWYTSAPLILCLLGDVHLIMGFVIFSTAKEPLKREDTKHGFERIAIWAFLNSMFSFISSVSQIVWHIKNGFEFKNTVITVSCIVLFVFSVLITKAKGCAEAKEG